MSEVKVRGHRRSKTGIVLKKSGTNTWSVNVEILKKHPLYQKYMKRSKRYLVHYEGEDVVVGDRVEIVETRPMSKRKSWRIRSVVATR